MGVVSSPAAALCLLKCSATIWRARCGTLTGDLQGEVRQLLRRQLQRTGAEIAARAAIGVRIFQHVREGRHRANFRYCGLNSLTSGHQTFCSFSMKAFV